MTEFSRNVATLQPSATIAVSSRVKQMIAQGEDILDLCVGEPDFGTPDFIAEAGIEAIREGKTRYTPAPGIPQLRAAIAHDLQRLSPTAEKIDPHGIVVSAGAKQALFNVIFSLFGPGDRVLIPQPYWTSYPPLVELARAEPVPVPGDASRDHKVGVDDLERAAAGGARGLLLNSPGNPTGTVYTLPELETIVTWAAKRNIWIISDEIYRRICFDSPLAPSILDLPAELRERAVVIDGASKAFAMTGWRIGFSLTSVPLAEKISALQSQTTSSATTPAQWAALAAYADQQRADAEIERMRSRFQSRRDLLVSLFREQLPQLPFVEPHGAFYLWISTARAARPGEGSVAFCERLLKDHGVALVPGEAFGDDTGVRLSFAYSEETLREAVRRLAKL
ncbi:pyridoxal phosphate-dependent aminotransferase [soil metagenome]